MIIDNSANDKMDIINNLCCSIDWISFTFDLIDDVSECIEFLGFVPHDFILMPKGDKGYRSMRKLNSDNIRILSDGNPNMGIHIDISGSAIESLLFAWQKKNTVQTPFNNEAVLYNSIEHNLLADLLSSLVEVGHFTRVDLAIDDIGCTYFSCDDILNLIENQQVISRFRNYKNIAPRLLKDGSKQGHTIYFGSRQSNVFLRIYDKKLEQLNKHRTLSHDWIRWELELKKEYSMQAIKMILQCNSLSNVCVGILSHYLRFINKDSANKSRCSLEPTWEAFINEAEKMTLYIPNAPKTIDDIKNWIDTFVGPSLSVIIENDNGSFDFIQKNLNKWIAKRRLNIKLTQCLEQSKKLKKLKEV